MSALGEKIQSTVVRNRRSVTIDIGDEDVTLWATPLTGQDMDWLSRKHKNFFANPTAAGTVDLIIRKAETEDGEKAFDLTDKAILVRMPLEWIGHVRAALFDDDDADMSDDAVEAEEKN